MNGPSPYPLADNSVFANTVVLVVDDHRPNLDLLERILGGAGARHIHLISDPHAVVDQYVALRPDLVLLDLHMPEMGGLAVMDGIRRVTRDDDFVPIIVLTADSTPEAREDALSAGASDFLTKPVDRTEVVLRARNLLHARLLHGRLRAHNAQLRSEIAARDAADERARSEASDKVRRLRRVLEDDQPRIVFQPIVQLDRPRIVGYEALARFDHQPLRTPDVWFAEAAEVGLGVELELAALRLALQQFPSTSSGPVLTLNVSPTTALTSALADLLAGHDPERLVLEITEHAPVDDYDELVATLGRLRSTGLRLAVDDAGAGFASLHHILLLRPDVIKLDISLVRDINQDPVKRALASSLVTFARDIGSTIVAEGIETPAELATLVELGVPWGQGFYLGRPDRLANQRSLVDHR